MENPTAYDYRMYDQIWKRVSPDMDPYEDIHAAQQEADDPSPALSALSTQNSSAVSESVETLPGAQLNPCCMGSEAAESIRVLEGFIEEELAQRRCYLGLASRICHSGAAGLLRRIAGEKYAAAQSLKTAYYLITGTCYENLISIDHMRWNSLCDALRSCYHQEACNGFNYRRAADETVDPCLQKLLLDLAKNAFARADAVMALLGHMI